MYVTLTDPVPPWCHAVFIVLNKHHASRPQTIQLNNIEWSVVMLMIWCRDLCKAYNESKP